MPRKGRALVRGLPENHFALIGEFIVEWSRLEIILGTLIWSFLRLDMEDGRVVTGMTDARTKLRMLVRLARRHVADKDVRKTFLDMLDVAKGLSEDRNFIAHGTWGTMMPDNQPAVSSVRQKSDPFHVQTQIFTADDLAQMISITRDAAEWLYEFGERLPSLLEKWRTPPRR